MWFQKLKLIYKIWLSIYKSNILFINIIRFQENLVIQGNYISVNRRTLQLAENQTKYKNLIHSKKKQ